MSKEVVGSIMVGLYSLGFFVILLVTYIKYKNGLKQANFFPDYFLWLTLGGWGIPMFFLISAFLSG